MPDCIVGVATFVICTPQQEFGFNAIVSLLLGQQTLECFLSFLIFNFMAVDRHLHAAAGVRGELAFMQNNPYESGRCKFGVCASKIS